MRSVENAECRKYVENFKFPFQFHAEKQSRRAMLKNVIGLVIGWESLKAGSSGNY